MEVYIKIDTVRKRVGITNNIDIPYKYSTPFEIASIVDAWGVSNWELVEKLSEEACEKEMRMNMVKVQELIDKLFEAREMDTSLYRTDELIEDVILYLKMYQKGITELEK